MARLVLFALALLVVAVSAIAVAAAFGSVRRVPESGPRHRGDTMPDVFRTVAYMALLLLMFGIVTGLLGAG